MNRSFRVPELSPWRQLQALVLAIVVLISIGTLGFMLISGADPMDSLLMTVTTISTVGYGEIVPLDSNAAKVFSIFLMLAALTVLLSAFRSLGELVLTRTFWAQLGRQRMQNRIDKMRNHTIICGHGRLGSAVRAELGAEGLETVVIEDSEKAVAQLMESRMAVVEGDAMRDDTLLRAGVKRARALVAVTDTDAANLMIVLGAKDLNPDLAIVARAVFPDSVDKLRRAGAHYVLHPHGTGAMHLALAVTHPAVESVLGLLLPRSGGLDLGQVQVSHGDRVVGRTLAEIPAQDNGALVLAVQRDGEMIVPPDPHQILKVGDVLVVAGTSGALDWLTGLCSDVDVPHQSPVWVR